MIDYRIIGNRLKKAREDLQLTQETLAESVGITAVYLSRIENGKVHPTLEVLYSICDVLNVDMGYLFGNVVSESSLYQKDKLNTLYNSLPSEIKPVAINILEQLTKIKKDGR